MVRQNGFSGSRSARCCCSLGLGLYIGLYLTNVPGSVAATTNASGTHLYLATVPAAEPSDAHPTWVSYYVVNADAGSWRHDTTYVLPARTLVHVTIYQYDGDSGLRNPFLSQAQGTTGGVFTLNGKPTRAIDPNDASHVFAIPQIGLSVPLEGVPATAKNPCAQRPVHACAGPRDDLVQFPHARAWSVPLAVLRPLRGGVHRGLGRADADRRVHGRLHQGRMRRVR